LGIVILLDIVYPSLAIIIAAAVAPVMVVVLVLLQS
jgi:hypothetical protein